MERAKTGQLRLLWALEDHPRLLTGEGARPTQRAAAHSGTDRARSREPRQPALPVLPPRDHARHGTRRSALLPYVLAQGPATDLYAVPAQLSSGLPHPRRPAAVCELLPDHAFPPACLRPVRRTAVCGPAERRRAAVPALQSTAVRDVLRLRHHAAVPLRPEREPRVRDRTGSRPGGPKGAAGADCCAWPNTGPRPGNRCANGAANPAFRARSAASPVASSAGPMTVSRCATPAGSVMSAPDGPAQGAASSRNPFTSSCARPAPSDASSLSLSSPRGPEGTVRPELEPVYAALLQVTPPALLA